MNFPKDQTPHVKGTVFSYAVSHETDPYFALSEEIAQFYSTSNAQHSIPPQYTDQLRYEPKEDLETMVKNEHNVKIESQVKTEVKIEEEIKLKMEFETGHVPIEMEAMKEETTSMSTTISLGNKQPKEDSVEDGTLKKDQPQYKNKLKEPLERAKVILKEICKFTPNRIAFLREEAMKSDLVWLEEGEKLRGVVQKFENDLQNLTGPKLKSSKRIMMQKIVDKKYCMFVDLFQYKEKILELMSKSDIIHNFKDYKDRISSVYFTRTEFRKQEDLMSWILLTKIGTLILPESPERVEILPLTKNTVYFNYWLIESPMKPRNKELYRLQHVRDHLRAILVGASKNLMKQAYRRLSKKNLDLVLEMLRAIMSSMSEKTINVVPEKSVEENVENVKKEELNVKRLYDEIKEETDLDNGWKTQKIVCKEENK